jgi:hypothetical protein
LEEYRQAVESARSNPVGQIPTLLNASTTITTTTTTTTTATTISKPKPINSKVLDKKSKNALKGALILKKKKRDSESEDEQEQPTDKKLKTDGDKKKPASTNNKATGSLGLLSAYGDISSSSDSEDDS